MIHRTVCVVVVAGLFTSIAACGKKHDDAASATPAAPAAPSGPGTAVVDSGTGGPTTLKVDKAWVTKNQDGFIVNVIGNCPTATCDMALDQSALKAACPTFTRVTLALNRANGVTGPLALATGKLGQDSKPLYAFASYDSGGGANFQVLPKDVGELTQVSATTVVGTIDATNMGASIKSTFTGTICPQP